MKYRPEIDGLRAIAILPVLIYHAEIFIGDWQLLQGGFLGVDVFFVISGYLITSIILEEIKKTGGFSFANFYERRIRRLFPALMLVIFASLPLAWYLLLPSQLEDFSKSLIWSIFFGSNFYWLVTLQEYGAESALLKPFLHTWSLAVEEQFYLIFPWLIILLRNRSKSLITIVLALLFLVSLQVAESLNDNYQEFVFYMLPSRFWELLAGAALAYNQFIHPEHKRPVWSNALPSIGLMLILVSMLLVKYDSGHPGYMTLLPVTGTVMLIGYSGIANQDIVFRLLTSKLFVFIGLISYSLYLWHYPIFAFGRLDDGAAGILDKLGWLVATFVLSYLGYRFIEKPCRTRNKISFKKLFWILVISISFSIGFVIASFKHADDKARLAVLSQLYGKNDFDNKRLSLEANELLDQLAEKYGYGPQNPIIASDFEKSVLTFSDDKSTQKVLIIGNSHSRGIYNAFVLNQNLFSGYEFARYAIQIDAEEEKIEEMLVSPNYEAADIILISSRYGKNQKRMDEQTGAMPSFLSALTKTDKQIILTSNTVEFDDIEGKPVFDWYIQNTPAEGFSEVELKKLFYKQRNETKLELNDNVIQRIARDHNVYYLNKHDYLCDDLGQTCDGITPEGYKAFWDYGHFTIEGAKHFGKKIHQLNWLNRFQK